MNEKIMRWRIELSCYHYIIYRPETENAAADTFSRMQCSATSNRALYELHASLCHPGVTRMMHFVRCRNLPYSVDDVRSMTAACPDECAELKPRYHTSHGDLVKATRAFERINVDFKGPIPSGMGNRCMLTVVDEYSRFPFLFPCRDMSATIVINCLCQLFSVFSVPAYVHSDRGQSFMPTEFSNEFLQSRGVTCSRTTPCNPEGNGQVGRYNGVIWKAVSPALKSRQLPTAAWQRVLLDALHSIRTLLSTATNETPHEHMFAFQRCSSNGDSVSVPTRLSSPGRVLLKLMYARVNIK